MQVPHFRTAAVAFVTGVLFAVVSLPQLATTPGPSVANAQQPVQSKPDFASLQTEVERLKQVVPDQAHAMQDVDYHFTNLWFAANQSNWDLAQFYWGETRSHLRWAVRIIPVRKDTAGRDVKLQDILQAVANTPLKQLEEAIKAKDREKFSTAYEFTLASCYSCHKAVDKPYLRPRIPEHPASTMINFDPNATWPK